MTIDETLRPSPILIKPSDMDAARGSDGSMSSPPPRDPMTAAVATPVRHCNGLYSSPVPLRKSKTSLASALAFAHDGTEAAELAPPPPRPAAAPPKGGRRADRSVVADVLSSHPAFAGGGHDGTVLDQAVGAVNAAATAMSASLLQQMPPSLFIMHEQSEAGSEEFEYVDPLRRRGRNGRPSASPNILKVKWGGSLSGDNDEVSSVACSCADSRPNSRASSSTMASTYASSSRAGEHLDDAADASFRAHSAALSVASPETATVAFEPKPPPVAQPRRGSFLTRALGLRPSKDKGTPQPPQAQAAS